MKSKVAFTAVALASLMAAPAFAGDGQEHHRTDGQRQASGQASHESAAPRQQQEQRQQRQQPTRENDRREAAAPRQAQPRQQTNDRRYNNQRAPEQRGEIQRRAEVPQRSQVQRRNDAQPRYETARPYDGRRYENARPAPRYEVARPYRGGSRFAFEVGVGGYRPYGYGYTPRVIRPVFVGYDAYRPYYYHPSLRIGVSYGYGGIYPYGAIPEGYYNPLPGHYYGGLRITGAPRDAQVFADGYYVGIVNDFDGVFQHLNLEAGGHHIEVDAPGLEPIAFDVDVQPGRTTTFRADFGGYRPY